MYMSKIVVFKCFLDPFLVLFSCFKTERATKHFNLFARIHFVISRNKSDHMYSFPINNSVNWLKSKVLSWGMQSDRKDLSKWAPVLYITVIVRLICSHRKGTSRVKEIFNLPLIDAVVQEMTKFQLRISSPSRQPQIPSLLTCTRFSTRFTA